MTPPSAAVPDLIEILEDCRNAGKALLACVQDLDDASLRAPSYLPGWSRGHVLAHLTNVGNGAARQAEFADRGERVEFYDGGRAGRDAAIESDATRAAPEHAGSVARMLDRLAGAWPADGSAVWDRPVTYRDGTVADVAFMWWREILIHLVDLDVGVAADRWSDGFCRHLCDFLAPRLPVDRPVNVHFPDSPVWSAPDRPRTGIPLIIEGTLRDVALWLAGRSPVRAPVALWDGTTLALPDLDPWPSARQ